MSLSKDRALGCFVGCAIGDAFGAPFEFMSPEDIVMPEVYVAGGMHDVAAGEYTDDTAMMMAAASAYVKTKGFSPSVIAENFKLWKTTGAFGTRDYVFDIGKTCAESINHMTPTHPYAGKATQFASGNGSIMRIAPAIVANHRNVIAAVGESVALALMTHGNSDTVTHISAFVAEVFCGFQQENLPLKKLMKAQLLNPAHGRGSIMQSFSMAFHCAHYSEDFLDAIQHAVAFGYDTDTNAAVTGMYYGGRVGLSNIPTHLVEGLMNSELILQTANELYDLGCTR